MNLARFTQIVSAYGSKPTAWPEAERSAAEVFVTTNPNAKILLHKESLLDNQLDGYLVKQNNIAGLQSSLLSSSKSRQQTLNTDKRKTESTTIDPEDAIEENETPRFIDILIQWVLPLQPRFIWRPIIAACCPLVIGTLLGAAIDLQQDTEMYSSTDSWDDELALMFYIDSSEMAHE
ncbi:MAG: hypothetical protein KUG79_07980 [Pseudomonadales bacterium]|nr:hypothetical protein [Pseudomonadales bacterium]